MSITMLRGAYFQPPAAYSLPYRVTGQDALKQPVSFFYKTWTQVDGSLE
jgi:hypothetical protein